MEPMSKKFCLKFLFLFKLLIHIRKTQRFINVSWYFISELLHLYTVITSLLDQLANLQNLRVLDCITLGHPHPHPPPSPASPPEEMMEEMEIEQKNSKFNSSNRRHCWQNMNQS